MSDSPLHNQDSLSMISVFILCLEDHSFISAILRTLTSWPSEFRMPLCDNCG
jgi:hypothetical protein